MNEKNIFSSDLNKNQGYIMRKYSDVSQQWRVKQLRHEKQTIRIQILLLNALKVSRNFILFSFELVQISLQNKTRIIAKRLMAPQIPNLTQKPA